MRSVFDAVREEGRKEGEKKGIVKTARNLFKQGFDFNQVSESCPDLNQNELISIQQEALNSNS